jgi:Sulfotransferase family
MTAKQNTTEALDVPAEVRSALAVGRIADAARLWHEAALVALRQGRPGDALAHFRGAHLVIPDDMPFALDYAYALLNSGQPGAALCLARTLSHAPPSRSAALEDRLGSLLTYCEEPALARRHFESAVAADPRNPTFRFNLAMVQRMEGDLAAAEDNLDRVLAAQPEDGNAQLTRSDLRVQTEGRNHIPELRALLDRLGDRAAAIPAGFALAKELEDVGHYAESFARVAVANARVHSRLRYDVAEDTAVLQELRKTHVPARLISHLEAGASERCVFVIGLARSGTTLLETLIGRHSCVRPGGELTAFAQAVVATAYAAEGRRVPKLELIERSLLLNPASVADRYFTEVAHRVGTHGLFIDKQPLNYLYIGLIRRALPGARIIWVRRNPMDSCYALFKTLFRDACPFSYSLTDLARYFVEWDALMRHWVTVAGAALLTIDYEDLVQSTEATCRRVIEHCGLDWEEACAHTGAPGAVTTASAAQVRRPIYNSSVGLWRHYAHELQPIASALDQAGISYA